MPAGNTYEAIATTTLGSAGTVTFTSIPSTYTDLVIVCNVKNATAGNLRFEMQFNGDTGTNYSVTRIYGNGSTASSDRFTSDGAMDVGFFGGSNATDLQTSIIQVQNYSNSTTNKTALTRWNSQAGASGAQFVAAVVGLWRNTAAITSIKLGFNGSNNIAAGSSLTLYGIKAA